MVAGEIARPVDVLVLGGGPGGYTAAARVLELGRDVVLVESGPLGGTCLNVGCIPSKALITLAHDFQRVRHRVAAGTGLSGEVHVDLAGGRQWINGVVGRLRDGVETLLRGVEVVQGTGRFIGRDRVAVEAEDHVEHLQFREAIIATGSRPAGLPTLPIDQTRILDSTGALALTDIPDDLVVVGGGYIGIELGTAFANLGSRVTVVEAADRILGEFDDDGVGVVRRRLDELGVVVRTGTTLAADEGGDVVVESAVGKERVRASHVLVAVGRRPNTDDLQLEEAGLATAAGGRIAVDEQRRTAVPTIFAIGDVTDGPALAHKAYAEGRVAAEVLCGLPSAFDQLVPIIAFCEPELAAVGLGEADARATGRQVVIGKANFGVNGRALTLDQPAGMVKLIVDSPGGFVVGALIAGPNASELIAELTVAVECALRIDDVIGSIHPHPTLGEAVVEAARAARRRLAPPARLTGQTLVR
jgi:dihydrolipoamide dehydrogenase